MCVGIFYILRIYYRDSNYNALFLLYIFYKYNFCLVVARRILKNFGRITNVHPFKSFCQIVALGGLFITSSAGAAIITDSGIDTIQNHFVIDSSVSTVTHDPGLVFVGDDAPPPPEPQSYAISGDFDVNFYRYWRSYYLDGDVNGTQGSFIYEQNWLTFNNANIVDDISPSGFQFPNYFVSENGSTLLEIMQPAAFLVVPMTIVRDGQLGQFLLYPDYLRMKNFTSGDYVHWELF